MIQIYFVCLRFKSNIDNIDEYVSAFEEELLSMAASILQKDHLLRKCRGAFCCEEAVRNDLMLLYYLVLNII